MIKARMNINVIGKPAQTVEEYLQKVLEKIKVQRKIDYSKILKPERVGKEFFSGFLEVEAEFTDFSDLTCFILDYNPMLVEIIEPDELKIGISDMQTGVSELVARIQEYEDGLKALRATNLLLQKELGKNSPKNNSNIKKQHRNL